MQQEIADIKMQMAKINCEQNEQAFCLTKELNAMEERTKECDKLKLDLERMRAESMARIEAYKKNAKEFFY